MEQKDLLQVLKELTLLYYQGDLTALEFNSTKELLLATLRSAHPSWTLDESMLEALEVPSTDTLIPRSVPVISDGAQPSHQVVGEAMNDLFDMFEAGDLSDEEYQLTTELLLNHAQQSHDELTSAQPAVVRDPTIPIMPHLANVALRAQSDHHASPTLQPTLHEGQILLQRYTLGPLLGQGTTGQVFLCTDQMREGTYALKLIHPHLAHDKLQRQRFMKELRSAEHLAHPGIVRTYNLEEDPSTGILFYTMEYVEGETLNAILGRAESRGQIPLMPLGWCHQLLAELTHILEYIHARGLVYRDLKPSNVMITPEGFIKLMDFAIAESLEKTAVGPLAAFAGLGYYMAPEQQRGKGEVKPAADVFSLGVLSYQLLTGELPIGRVARPSHLWDALTTEIDDILLCAMDPRPSRRYATPRLFWQALSSALASVHDVASPPPHKSFPPQLTPYPRHAFDSHSQVDVPSPSFSPLSVSGMDYASHEGAVGVDYGSFQSLAELPQAASLERPAPDSEQNISLQETEGTEDRKPTEPELPAISLADTGVATLYADPTIPDQPGVGLLAAAYGADISAYQEDDASPRLDLRHSQPHPETSQEEFSVEESHARLPWGEAGEPATLLEPQTTSHAIATQPSVAGVELAYAQESSPHEAIEEVEDLPRRELEAQRLHGQHPGTHTPRPKQDWFSPPAALLPATISGDALPVPMALYAPRHKKPSSPRTPRPKRQTGPMPALTFEQPMAPPMPPLAATPPPPSRRATPRPVTPPAPLTLRPSSPTSPKPWSKVRLRDVSAPGPQDQEMNTQPDLPNATSPVAEAHEPEQVHATLPSPTPADGIASVPSEADTAQTEAAAVDSLPTQAPAIPLFTPEPPAPEADEATTDEAEEVASTQEVATVEVNEAVESSPTDEPLEPPSSTVQASESTEHLVVEEALEEPAADEGVMKEATPPQPANPTQDESVTSGVTLHLKEPGPKTNRSTPRPGRGSEEYITLTPKSTTPLPQREQLRLLEHPKVIEEPVATAIATKKPAAPVLPPPPSQYKHQVLHARSGLPLLRLIEIPEGPFVMGSKGAVPLAYRSERPQRSVRLSTYWISQTPLTNEVWRIFAEESGYRSEHPDYLRHWRDGRYSKDKANHPVVYVGKEDLDAFCDFYDVTLPTEAQWEKAARGNDGQLWPWGDQKPHPSLSNFLSSKLGDTTPVDAYPKGLSPYGLYDCSGNVWELCADNWDLLWLEHMGDDPVDPFWHDPESNSYTMRGGYFNYHGRGLRCAFRFNSSKRDLHIGVRIARPS